MPTLGFRWIHNFPLRWRHNEHEGVSNHRRFDCLLNPMFRSRSRRTSKLHVTGLREGNLPVTGGFPSQRNSNAENVSMWWRHHEMMCFYMYMGWGTFQCVVIMRYFCSGLISLQLSDNICVSKLGQHWFRLCFSPLRCQAIIWTNVGLLYTGFFRIYSNKIWIKMQQFNKMNWKMPSAHWRRFCLGRNALIANLVNMGLKNGLSPARRLVTI